MRPLSWPCPTADGNVVPEYALAFEPSGPHRLLMIPALFDEANRLRRFTVETMRLLAEAGIACVLPDLPGCNESLQDLAIQTPDGWAHALAACVAHFQPTHVLGLRGGCLFTPSGLPALHFAPIKGASILRQMLRARILSTREAGREETREELETMARTHGIALAGYTLGAAFVQAFESMEPPLATCTITQGELGGSGLWLRAEPSEDTGQAVALAQRIQSALESALP